MLSIFKCEEGILSTKYQVIFIHKLYKINKAYYTIPFQSLLQLQDLPDIISTIHTPFPEHIV